MVSASYGVVNVVSSFGFMAPKGTPKPIIDKLNAAFQEAAKPTWESYIAANGADLISEPANAARPD